jgi:hypothetical protein
VFSVSKLKQNCTPKHEGYWADLSSDARKTKAKKKSVEFEEK